MRPEDIALKLAKIVVRALASVTYVVIDVEGDMESPVYFEAVAEPDASTVKKLSVATGEWMYSEMLAL